MDVLARANALEAAGRRVVHMEIGEPDFSAAPQVVEAAVRALRDGRTAYTATLGLPALREAIAAHYGSCFSKKLTPDRIAITSGASGGLLLTLALYVNPGDEIYQGLVYGMKPGAEAPATALGLPGEVVIVNSFSKYFCMTGWRLGWVVLPRARMREFEKLAQHLFICAPAISQHAALACFTPATLKVLEGRRREFQRRRDFLIPALERAGLAVPARPSDAFYVYADCGLAGRHQVPLSGKRFAFDLLEQAGVAATPGIDFGANGTQRYMRFAYTRSMADLEEAARRVKKFCSGKVRPPRRAGSA